MRAELGDWRQDPVANDDQPALLCG
jgi:hypothetical protein